MSKMHRLIVIGFVLILPLILQKCASLTNSSASNNGAPFCDLAKPIFWVDGDTNETIEQIKEHNAVGKDKCHWGDFGAAGFGQGGFGIDTVDGNVIKK